MKIDASCWFHILLMDCEKYLLQMMILVLCLPVIWLQYLLYGWQGGTCASFIWHWLIWNEIKTKQLFLGSSFPNFINKQINYWSIWCLMLIIWVLKQIIKYLNKTRINRHSCVIFNPLMHNVHRWWRSIFILTIILR